MRASRILYDWSHNNNTPDHADEAVRGLKDAGLRAVFGYGNANDEWIPPSTLPTNFSDIERVRRSHFSSDDQLVTMAFAARGPQFTTLDITADEFRRARDLGLRITVHVGDGIWGTTRPVVQLASRGLLGDDITYVHCNTLTDEDFHAIGDSGATASISPEVELQMGHGFLATVKLLGVGVRPSPQSTSSPRSPATCSARSACCLPVRGPSSTMRHCESAALSIRCLS